MLLPIVAAGDPVLRQRARPLDAGEIRSAEIVLLVDQMRETMRAAPGVGLAAPQVGQPLQLAVVEDRAEYQREVPPEELAARRRVPVPFHVIINPRLTVADPGPAVFAEGCLSVPGYIASVSRSLVVRVEALDHNAQPVSITAHGWYARILQHEIDHLNGVLYVDRMDPRTLAAVRRAPPRSLDSSAR